MSGSFFGKRKTQTVKKGVKEDLSFTLKNIDVARIDKDFSMTDMKNIGHTSDLVFDTEDKGTSLEKLGISSLKREPITTILTKEKTKLQTFITMIDHLTDKRLPQQTNIPCFGCHRCFDTIPLGVPIAYYPSVYISKDDPTKIKKLTINDRLKLEADTNNNINILEYFDTDGIVCSFNCIFSVIEDNPSPLYRETSSLVPKMYKMIFGEYPKSKIIRSPSWRLREEYGGPLSDEDFVRNLQSIQYTDMHQINRVLRIMNPVGRVFKVNELNNC